MNDARVFPLQIDIVVSLVGEVKICIRFKTSVAVRTPMVVDKLSLSAVQKALL